MGPIITTKLTSVAFQPVFLSYWCINQHTKYETALPVLQAEHIIIVTLL